ncbi:MAG TPA: protein translocase subunit SecF [Hyphomonadaceae bacterium]|nr:protein translocase subunit SecF [Hyphomonadaceae bacterium]HPN05713.1 protein translocase subunit SecF [Hyphomonadaceae bacterium]
MWWDKPGKKPKPEGKPLPFMKIRWVGFIVTTMIFVVTTISLATQGLNLGLDFTGGVQIEATRSTPFDVASVRDQVLKAGFEDSVITTSNAGQTLIIRLPVETGAEEVPAIAQKVTQLLGEGVSVQVPAVVGPKVSGELFMSGVLAAVLAVVGIGMYVWFRFEVKFGTGAFVTTFHDVYAVVGLFSITQMTFDLTIVAGVLTVAGYSINDTVVVYDRIREMLKKYKKLPITEVIDISITSTLSRTIMTSVATMMAAGAMAFLGGPVLFGFAVSIMFGIIIGTYSSIFVAAPMLIHLPGRLPGAKYTGADAPVKATP